MYDSLISRGCGEVVKSKENGDGIETCNGSETNGIATENCNHGNGVTNGNKVGTDSSRQRHLSLKVWIVVTSPVY